MVKPMSRDQQREWLLEEIRKDAKSHAGSKRRGDAERAAKNVYYGRLDALVRVAWYFDFAERDELKRFVDKVEKGQDPSIEDIKDPLTGK